MEIISDYLAGLGLDVIKDSAAKKLDESKLKNRLKTFIEEQRKYNEVCSLAEECDFQGLIEYISDNMMETGEYFKGALGELETPILLFTYVGITEVNIFGAQFSFKFKRTYREAVMQDIERIQKLVEQLKEGDPLRIQFKPGDDNTGFDTINISDELLEVDEQVRSSDVDG